MNKIVYGNRTFTDSDIDSCSIHITMNLISAQLESNTFTAIVRSADATLTDFERNAKLTFYLDKKKTGIFYIQSIDRIGGNLYKIFATSAVGLLIEGQHYGGIYTGQTAQEIISSICGDVPFIVKSNLVGTKLYGWLPIASPRDNLSQVLFALGASLKTDFDGVLRIAGLWDGMSGSVFSDRMYTGAKVDYTAKITQIVVTEHQYSKGNETKQLFEGTAQEGDIIFFNAPMHSLSASGITILEQGANYAKVSAGSGTLSGKEYIHNKRLTTRDVLNSNTPNVKTVDKATLVSVVNSYAVANRLAEFYKCYETIDVPSVYNGEDTGNCLFVSHPFNKEEIVQTCLQSADITISNTIKAQLKTTKGFIPQKIDNVEYLDAQMVVETSGPIYLPADAIPVRAILISGGQGGSAGYDSAAATAGTSATVQSPSTGESSGTAGVGGEGGEPGTPGQGGNILEIELDLNDGDVLIAHIGVGGNGSATPGQPGALGTATTLTVGTQVFSSANGSPSNTGYTDVITGNVYATPGQPGKKGGNGGRGGTSGARAQPGGNVDSAVGGETGNNVYTERDVYGIHIIEGGWFAGGGGAAFGQNGADASGINGGNGADAAAPANAQRPGAGGDAGHGGGGPGGGGAGYASAQGNPTSSSASWRAYGSGGLPGTIGKGSKGAKGGHGAIILYLSVEKRQPGGEFRDKYGRPILEKEIRRFIV